MNHIIYALHDNGSALVYRNNEVQEVKQTTDLELPYHRVASCTKPVISLLAHISEDSGKYPFKITNNISEYFNEDEILELLPNFKKTNLQLKPYLQVSIYQLFTHTSGLPCFGGDNPKLNEQLYGHSQYPLTIFDQLSLRYQKTALTSLFHKILANPYPYWSIILFSALGTFLSVKFGDELIDQMNHKDCTFHHKHHFKHSLIIYAVLFMLIFAGYYNLLDSLNIENWPE